MPTSVYFATCPACSAQLSDDRATCARCGASVGVWRDVERTPLILPGNPALSEDFVRRKVSPLRIAGGVTAGSVALLGALWFATAEGSAPSEAQLADAHSAMETIAESASARSLSELPEPATPRASALAAAAPPPVPVPGPLPPIPAVVPPSLLPADKPAMPVATSPASAPVATLATRPPAPLVAKAAPASAPAVVASGRAASAPPATVTATPGTPAPEPVLRMARLVSDSLRPGELLQLRGSVRDRLSGRALPNRIEFTSTNASVASVDRSTGIVSARRPGRVRIVADAGGASMQAVDLIVRAPAPPPAPRVLATAPDRAGTTRPAALPPTTAAARTPAARPAATVAAATVPQRPPAAAPPRAADTRVPERAPDVVSTPAAPPVATAPPEQRATPVRVSAPVSPTPTPTREVARVSTPDEDDVRLAAERLTRDVRNGRSRSIQVTQFLGDGADHRITMLGEPAVLGANANGVRVAFAVRLTKFDGGGRPVTRIASVSMDVEKRDGAVSSSAVSISDLRRP